MQITHVSCSKKDFQSSEGNRQHRDRFPSASFNHFENGVLFTDIDSALEILWKASFKENNAYKENLGFFVNGGLLILPNKNNTYKSAKLGALQTRIDSGKFYVKFAGTLSRSSASFTPIQMFIVAPSQPQKMTINTATSGIHNYVMDHLNLFDAYKNTWGHEVYKRLGPRNAYNKIPLNKTKESVAVRE